MVLHIAALRLHDNNFKGKKLSELDSPLAIELRSDSI